ncbi:NXPE family member 3-like isoform X2 [Plectropomus leopardus]|uniref:NXPE family member 3-like isoform X2 n=1 Tax=Plectropomus leopardus TaxID=160734 RepID=UPI001C4A78AE|nr:NXPE family member 3-like isoform X2 [Plectropomus leopardus]
MRVRACTRREYTAIFLIAAFVFFIFVIRHMEVVEVTLVHSSEAIPVLSRLNTEHPNRVHFGTLYQSGSLSETTACSFCLHPTQKLLCNYTDLRTGEPWFCEKPKKLSCDARIQQSRKGIDQVLTANEAKLFQSRVNMKVFIQASGPANVTVLPKEEGQPEVKSSSVTSGPSGYYYQGMWQALDGTTVKQFTSSAITQCLKGKVLYLYGDSTVRQWFEFLNIVLPDLKEFNLHSLKKLGPFMALDYGNNIMVTFRLHGPPIVSFAPAPPSKLYYIANEIDSLTGGPNTVVAFGVWAHFAPFPMEVYIRRLRSIRRAVVRLLTRAPGTVVIIRTGNPRALTPDLVHIFSDWYSLQRSKVLRAMFKGLNVHLVEAWEMVVAHHLPHNLHPEPPIIKNMIDVIMSHVCPRMGS